MVSSEVQRTLVKSPPELWAELSDPAALARHLGELGEIRITRVQPEKKVEWEADETSGTVLIDPSGWGTKVTLTVTRETPQAESPPSSELLPEPEATTLAEPEPIVDRESSPSGQEHAEPTIAIDSESALRTGAESGEPLEAGPDLQSEPEGVVAIDEASTAEQERELRQDQEVEPEQEIEPEELEPEHELETEHELENDFMPELEPRRGFFARLFRRHWATPQPSFESGEVGLEPPAEPADAFAAVTRALAPETFAAAHPFIAAHPTGPTHVEPVSTEEAALTEPPAETSGDPYGRAELQAPAEAESTLHEHTQAEQADDISAEIRAAEDAAAEEITAVLTSVLDRLGAAHHRPFSRA
jgi:hypothetical protein